MGHDADQLAQYKSREPQFAKLSSAQQPFQFASQQDLQTHALGFRPRTDEERIHPEQWEQMAASYNDWELGMLYKLAKGECSFFFITHLPFF